MSAVTILGAGPIGSTIAHRLAQRGRLRDLLLVDAAVDGARGKALDIRQSGPIECFDTRLTAGADPLAASGAAVVVLADRIDGGDWTGAPGRELVEQLVRAGSKAAFVFAGAGQIALMETSFRTIGVPADRLVGTAPSAVAGAVRALTALELNLAAVELTVTGRPPKLVVGWSAATTGGVLVTDRVPAHRLLAISGAVPRLWPPGPYAIAAATAAIVEALLAGSRRLHPALAIVDGELGVRGRAVMLPLELGRGRVLSRVMPSLSPQERTDLINGISVDE